MWSLRERQRFLDTVLKNYPSPAIFLHVTFDELGIATYHVVDGKQRLSAIFAFVDNKLRLGSDIGDNRLENQRWKDLEMLPAVRRSLWTYQLTVEQLDDVKEPLVREIFERLNRNSRKLERQEMRHARFDGWLINFLEGQAEQEIWREVGVSSTARAKRMADVQILSELALVRLRRDVQGFDQEALDQLYADFEDPETLDPDFDVDRFEQEFETLGLLLRGMKNERPLLAPFLRSVNHLYPLWAFLVLSGTDISATSQLAEPYAEFMAEVERLRAADAGDAGRDRTEDNPNALLYLQNSVGASTELPQRSARLLALSRALGEPIILNSVTPEDDVPENS